MTWGAIGLCHTPRAWWDRSDRARVALSPSADLQQQLHPHVGLVGGFTAVTPADDGLIHDSVAQRTAPDAAELVVVRRLNVGFTVTFETAQPRVTALPALSRFQQVSALEGGASKREERGAQTQGVGGMRWGEISPTV